MGLCHTRLLGSRIKYSLILAINVGISKEAWLRLLSIATSIILIETCPLLGDLVSVFLQLPADLIAECIES